VLRLVVAVDGGRLRVDILLGLRGHEVADGAGDETEKQRLDREARERGKGAAVSWLKQVFGPRGRRDDPTATPETPRPPESQVPASPDYSSGIAEELEERRRTEELARRAGTVRGHFYVDLVPELNRLRSEKNDDEGLKLLIEIIEAAERTAQIENRTPPPGYTERATVILRRRKRYADELDLIDRYEFQRQLYAAGDPYDQGSTTWARLEKRRVKARELAGEH
jgi:hypothetical protein